MQPFVQRFATLISKRATNAALLPPPLRGRGGEGG
jgi:hypothetical protein